MPYIVIVAVILIYALWTVTHENHTECENPECDTCPFPCDRRREE